MKRLNERKINAKSWDPALEKTILKDWEKNDIYNLSSSEQKKPFVIDTPPPYPSGKPWHIGAAAHYAQIDMIARTARMMNYNVLFPIGIDRNGLPVEIYTEKKHNIRMRQMNREEFIDLCKITLDKLEDDMIQIMKNMGMSGNFSEYYRTDSKEFRGLTQSTFIDLWNRGLIYMANRPNNYCFECGTTIADAEIIYEEIPTKLVYMSFNVEGSSNKITVASTRPELLFACQSIIVNPNDQRYKDLHGKRVQLPIFNRSVKIFPHHSVKQEFGSGAVMVCSYGDHNDVNIFRELGLKEIVALNEVGLTTTNAGPYANLRVKNARKKIIEDLDKLGIIQREESIVHRTPLCERSKTPIEILPLQDYYLKQLDYIPKLKELAEEIKFHPQFHKQILVNWLDSVSIDWPISRRRYYGTEIPVWFCISCHHPMLPEPGNYYRPWKEKPPFVRCIKCGGNEFSGEVRIFDTWMDSSISPLFITKYQQDKAFHKNYYPTRIRPQAKDIVRTWLYYTLLRCYTITGRIPWSDAWIMGFGLDDKGEKMSKSKGNVIDPLPIIEKYGADTFRFWSASEVNLGYDFRCSEEKIANSQKFLSKIWNIARFISSFDEYQPAVNTNVAQLLSSDKWVLAELSQLIQSCKNAYNEFNFFMVAKAIREFTWELFAPHYLEMVKGRAYNKEDKVSQTSALFALHRCFSTILLLLAPICPFITEELWKKMYSVKSIHLQVLPSSEGFNEDLIKYTRPIIDFNSLVWNKKKQTISPITGNPLSLKDSIEMLVPPELESFEKDLVYMHNLKLVDHT